MPLSLSRSRSHIFTRIYECTVAFARAFPSHPRVASGELDRAVARGKQFIVSIQRADGSWYGSWACCFTYGCWFGLEGLSLGPLGNEVKTVEVAVALRNGCAFLLSKQNQNGGWGEDFTSCFDRSYAVDGMEVWGDDQGSGIVPTAWALLGLMAAQCEDADAVRRGVEYLQRRQLADGDWPQEGIAGVFNRACGISYTQYRNVFPIWALGRYANHYLHK